MARDNKVRINIRIDADLVEHFKREAEQTLKSERPAGYQTLINEALRECLDTREYLDRCLREERFQALER
ncbi:MAG: BrnA antitoxin family protein [Silvibacterium sp.]